MNTAEDAADRLPLAGRHVVVTRPAQQARTLADAIAEAGGTPLLFPVLEILDLDDVQPLMRFAERLDEFDLAIFISANAVCKALHVVLAERTWPARLSVATVGMSSEKELQCRGFTRVIAPRGRFDSEALLELAPLQSVAVAGKRIVIFRGDGGRELLGETLAARGAVIEYCACYRRGKPDLDPAPLFEHWACDRLDAITVTSSEGLRNLVDMVGESGRPRLYATPLFVPHERIAAQAQRLGVREIVRTAPGDDGLLGGLIDHFVARPPRAATARCA